MSADHIVPTVATIDPSVFLNHDADSQPPLAATGITLVNTNESIRQETTLTNDIVTQRKAQTFAATEALEAHNNGLPVILNIIGLIATISLVFVSSPDRPMHAFSTLYFEIYQGY